MAQRAYAPLSSSGLQLPETSRRWLAGELSDADYRAKLDLALADAEESSALVDGLPAHDAKPLYAASARLYLEHVRIHVASLDVDAGPQRDQVALLARRVRELGDRVFDRGHAIVDPDFALDQPDVDVNLPEEVPDWVAEGMAAGPPFDEPPPPPAATPPLRAATRPVQPEDDWLAAADRAGAPDGVDLDGDVADQARRFVAAAEALRAEPDPDIEGGRERSAVLRLGWLVLADAARAQQADLDDPARRLAAIGEELLEISGHTAA